MDRRRRCSRAGGRPDVEAMRKLLEIHVDFVGPNSKTPTREERLLERLDALDKVSKEIRTLVTVSSTRVPIRDTSQRTRATKLRASRQFDL